MRSDGCPVCKFEHLASLKRGNVASFIKRAINVHGDVYDYSQVIYVNAITPVEIICPNHGSFWQTPDKHTSGQTRCPKCSQQSSHGEAEIERWLDQHGIQYEREKRFDDLCGSTPNSRLRYDFFLPAYNMLVEFDGEQHFTPVRTKGKLSTEQAVVKHQRTVENDGKKTAYAEKHGYQLLRIRYDQDINSHLAARVRL
jgi:very-short-patch-repair endonuclease